jgi:RNA polymerase sigma factor (sigma-70 family)
MSAQAPHDSSRAPLSFATTRWSLVLAAAERGTETSAAALEALCTTYWYPLYAYARRRGLPPENAADQTQEFFARLVERDFLHTADPERGRFRAFLLTVFQRFLASEYERAQAQKRGGGRRFLSIDVAVGESRYSHEPVDHWSAEKLYARRWALTLLEQVLRELEAEYRERGRAALFDACRESLVGGEVGLSAAEIGRSLGMSETAVRVAMHRLRERYRELLQQQVRQTVDSPQQVDDELRFLRDALRGEA